MTEDKGQMTEDRRQEREERGLSLVKRKRVQTPTGKIALFLFLVLPLLLPSCFANVSGKFRAEEGVPQFIKVGQTTRSEVFDKLGEPSVHRFVAGRETAVYESDRMEFWFFYGTYKSYELVIRFENQVVSDARIEKAGSSWGCLMPPAYSNPIHPTP
jgi:hypothetical protein